MSDLFPPAPADRPSADERAAAARAHDRASLVRSIGWLLVSLSVVGVLLLGTTPAPYVVESPGPVIDTLGVVELDEGEVPLIEIDGAESFETGGRLDLLTVRLNGSPESPLNWIDLASAWFDPSNTVVPIEFVYPQGQTEQQSAEQSAVEMQNSQREAIAAALGQLEVEFDSAVEVLEVGEGEPAEGAIEAGDLIVTVGGEPTPDVSVLREQIGAHGTASPLEIVVNRDGVEQTVAVTPHLAEDGETPIIGVLVSGQYQFPFEVAIQLENVGGPSAGMMFALGIYDKLTPGALTGGEHIAGTGTIAAGGEVGPIGGIRQKMFGALDAGADWFLAPADNCAEVVGAVPGELEVFAVATLDEALEVVETIGSGGDLAALPRCR